MGEPPAQQTENPAQKRNVRNAINIFFYLQERMFRTQPKHETAGIPSDTDRNRQDPPTIRK